MSYSIKITSIFAKEAKRLAKKYPSFKEDYREFKESLQENPLQGDELTPGIRKIRMAIKSKGKGKSGGARVITFNVLTEEQKGMIVLVLIYDKSDFSTVDVNVVKELIRDEGFETEYFFGSITNRVGKCLKGRRPYGLYKANGNVLVWENFRHLRIFLTA